MAEAIVNTQMVGDGAVMVGRGRLSHLGRRRAAGHRSPDAAARAPA